MGKDKLFENKKHENFKFDEEVASVFDDMVSRSVPFYAELQNMIRDLVSVFSQDGTNVYDLGCSTGTTILHCLKGIKDRNIRYIGIDNSKEMLKRAHYKFRSEGIQEGFELREEDLLESKLEDSSVVTMNLTLQFIRPLRRKSLIDRIYHYLNDDGAFILVEKILMNNSRYNRVAIEFYYNFKRQNGYSETEIANKREALENVLVPYTLDENIEMIREAGFRYIDVFYKWHNFVGIIGVK